MFKASAARRGLFAGLFTYADLQQLAVICEQEGEPLEFGVDVNAARYVDGERETPNGEVRCWPVRALGGCGDKAAPKVAHPCPRCCLYIRRMRLLLLVVPTAKGPLALSPVTPCLSTAAG